MAKCGAHRVRHGHGELWGTRQAGLPDLKLADLAKDEPLLTRAQAAAVQVVAADAQLMGASQAVLRAVLRERFKEALELALAG